MARRRRGRDVHGVVLLDKPAGVSSNQALQQVRRLFDARKAGHTGSLDPFATGLLPICLGEATKTAGFLIDTDKRYRAVAHLGRRTDTGDVDGEVISERAVPALDEASIGAAMAALTGPIEQVPPMYSALKRDGQRLYEMARRGETVERAPRPVTIHELTLVRYEAPQLEFDVHCSKGTYVRVLAEDLAERLGTDAHLISLRRLSVGVFEGPMHTLEEIEQAAAAGRAAELLLPVDAGLAGWPRVDLPAEKAEAFGHGNPVTTAANEASGPVRVYADNGGLLGLAERTGDGLLKPRRVFQLGPADAAATAAASGDEKRPEGD